MTFVGHKIISSHFDRNPVAEIQSVLSANPCCGFPGGAPAGATRVDDFIGPFVEFKDSILSGASHLASFTARDKIQVHLIPINIPAAREIVSRIHIIDVIEEPELGAFKENRFLIDPEIPLFDISPHWRSLFALGPRSWLRGHIPLDAEELESRWLDPIRKIHQERGNLPLRFWLLGSYPMGAELITHLIQSHIRADAEVISSTTSGEFRHWLEQQSSEADRFAAIFADQHSADLLLEMRTGLTTQRLAKMARDE